MLFRSLAGEPCSRMPSQWITRSDYSRKQKSASCHKRAHQWGTKAARSQLCIITVFPFLPCGSAYRHARVCPACSRLFPFLFRPLFFFLSCRFLTHFHSVFSGLRCNVMTQDVMYILTHCKSIIYQFFSYIFAVTT